MHWEPGSPIVLRSVRDQQVRGTRTVTVVADRDDLAALYIAPGYPLKVRTGVRGGPRGRVRLTDTGQYEDVVWINNRVLILYRPGDAHTTQLFWDGGAEALSRWYIDLHEPLRRTPLGFDSRDHVLDVRVTADRSSWAWKDEDELAWHREAGVWPLPPEEELRAEGMWAITRLTASDPPLYREWEGWHPDPSWPVPSIPANWQEIFPSESS